MWRKHTACGTPHYGSPFGVSALSAACRGITSRFMLQLTLAKPLQLRGSHGPSCLLAPGPTPRQFVAAIYNQVHSQDALREPLAKKGMSPNFRLCWWKKIRAMVSSHVEQFVKGLYIDEYHFFNVWYRWLPLISFYNCSLSKLKPPLDFYSCSFTWLVKGWD